MDETQQRFGRRISIEGVRDAGQGEIVRLMSVVAVVGVVLVLASSAVVLRLSGKRTRRALWILISLVAFLVAVFLAWIAHYGGEV